MIGEDRRAAMRGNALQRDARKPSAPAQDEERRELEADDNSSLADAVEPRLASHPLPERSCSALPRVLPATRGPLRLRPSHRSHARDGPKSRPPPCSQPSALVRPQAIADRAAVRVNHASDALGNLPRSSDLRGGRNRSGATPSYQPESSFFTPHRFVSVR
jgi:hypothetical protein